MSNPGGPVRTLPFDADRAFRDLQTLCSLGPRVSGTEGMARQQALLIDHLRPLADRVELQRFEATQPSRPGRIAMANLVASWSPDRGRRALVCCHYDTRPIADREPDPADWVRPFLGANDGASGVAILMELARQLHSRRDLAVDLAFFDGEECVFDPDRDHYFLGSTWFARRYLEDRAREYTGAILLDLVGGRDAVFPVEGHSDAYAGRLVDEVWGLAEALGCDAFVDELGHDVYDDHLPLLAAGIPAVDVIDFEYPHWHRLTDIPANCDTDTLGQVGRVVGAWLLSRGER